VSYFALPPKSSAGCNFFAHDRLKSDYGICRVRSKKVPPARDKI